MKNDRFPRLMEKKRSKNVAFVFLGAEKGVKIEKQSERFSHSAFSVLGQFLYATRIIIDFGSNYKKANKALTCRPKFFQNLRHAIYWL